VTIRLYFDEDSMWQALITALRARGIDVQTALEATMIERADEDHLACATAQGRVLCSFNVGDFYRLHTSYMVQHQAHAGIVLARQQQYSVGEYMRRLLRLMTHLTAEEMHNRVEFLSAWGAARGEQAP
jgi:Tfp pilus assembly protein PilZ